MSKEFLFKKPFAYNGVKAIIPDDPYDAGRANFEEGFPILNETNILEGGVPPCRPDINGIFNIITETLIYQGQSGLYSYDENIDYIDQSILFHNDRYYMCIKENGPNSEIVEPGTNEDYWVDIQNLSELIKRTIQNFNVKDSLSKLEKYNNTLNQLYENIQIKQNSFINALNDIQTKMTEIENNCSIHCEEVF